MGNYLSFIKGKRNRVHVVFRYVSGYAHCICGEKRDMPCSFATRDEFIAKPCGNCLNILRAKRDEISKLLEGKE
jgi:hypothetical protein